MMDKTIAAQQEEIKLLKQELTTIRMTGMALYLAAHWKSDRLAPEAEEGLWKNFRQALGLPAGLSTRLLELRQLAVEPRPGNQAN